MGGGIAHRKLAPLNLRFLWAQVQGGDIIAKAPKKTPLSQRIEKAKQLKQQQGLSLGKIARLMGVSKTTIKNYLEDYPYKR